MNATWEEKEEKWGRGVIVEEMRINISKVQ